VTNQPASFLTRSHIFAAVFFTIFIFLLYQMARLLAPFSAALLWAAILGLALSPVHKRLLRMIKGRKGLAAGVITFSTLLVVVGPAIFFLAVLTAQAVNLYQWTSEFIQAGKLTEAWSRFASPTLDRLLNLPFLAEINLKGLLIKGLSQFSSGLASQIGSALKNTLLLVINLLIMLIFLFFILRDGESYYSAIMNVLPFTSVQHQSIARKFQDTFSAVINGVFLVALIQGVMTGLGFALFGVPLSVFWGFLAAILALLPVGGAMLVWVPGALYLYFNGATLQGVLLAIWGALLISLPDNFLKPLLIGRKAKLPTFLLFIGILGGLQVYGFLGILFGPLVVTLLTAFVQIYREEYAERHE
jgi:predicted PurR-regulated permease PerM